MEEKILDKSYGLDDIPHKEKAKKLSIKSGSGWGVMSGFGIRYIPPYALAIGASNTIIGLLSSIPSLLGTLSQLKSTTLIEKFPRKKIAFLSAAIQAFLWLPLILVGALYFFFGLSSYLSSILILLIYTLIAIAGTFATPAWNSWMKDLVGENSAEYFGKRTKIITTFELVSMIIAGIILEYFKKTGVFTGFLFLFVIAFLGRTFSSYFLSKKYEPKLVPTEGYYFSFPQFVKKMRHNNFGRFSLFTTSISFATNIAAPFMTVYMLKDLGLDYFQFTLITITSIALTVIMLPFWGKFASKYGNISVIKISGIFVCFVPILWFFTDYLIDYGTRNVVIYLVLVEAFSGFWWSGLNLSTANFVYDAVTRGRMALCVAYDSITSAIGVFIGALLGGIISSYQYPILGLKPILFIFLLSGILRILVAITLLPRVKEVRIVEKFKVGLIKTKIMLVPKALYEGLKREGHSPRG